MEATELLTVDGFTLSDIIGIIAVIMAACAALIAYFIMIAQYLIGRYTPLIVPVCVRYFMGRVPRVRFWLMLGSIIVCLAIALLGSVPFRTVAAFVAIILLVWSFVWLALALHSLLRESADSMRVVGWLADERPEVRRAAYREILVPAVTRTDLAAIEAVVGQALAGGVDDEKAVRAILLAQRQALGAQWIAPSLLDAFLTDLDAAALGRRQPLFEEILAEALRAGLPDVAKCVVDRLWSAIKIANPWERLHSEALTALGTIIWEVRPSDEAVPHHPWLDRPMVEPEGRFIQVIAEMVEDQTHSNGETPNLNITLDEFCWLLRQLMRNALDPRYLMQLIRLCERLVWHCPRERLIQGPVVQQLCFAVQAVHTCVYRGSKQDASAWNEPAYHIDEMAVDLAALVAASNKPQLLAKMMHSGAFMFGVRSILMKPEVIPMEGYDKVAPRWLAQQLAGMPLSKWLRDKYADKPVPELPIPVRQLHGITDRALVVGPPKSWPST